jgi:hypothetical protein
VTPENPIIDLLAAPPGPDWTIEGLAEQLLGTIASQPKEEAKEILLDAATATDRQSQRILRPLLACLARTGPEGPVWILGQFENKPGSVRVAFQRSSSPPQVSGRAQTTSELSVLTEADSPTATPANR